MKVGDLIRHKKWTHILGVILFVGERDIEVYWFDNQDKSWAIKRTVEVINASG